MEVFKLIPQIFFDIIARVVPGVVAMLLLHLEFPGFWRSLLEGISANQLDSNNAAVFSFLTLLGLSYLGGQIVAPLGILLENTGQSKETLAYLFAEDVDLKRPIISALREELGNPSAYCKSHEKVIWYWYDWLRVHAADAGALTAKLRAEYSMYYSLSVVLALAAIGESISGGPISLAVLILTVLAVLMAKAGRVTNWTFRKSVGNMYYVAKHENSPCA